MDHRTNGRAIFLCLCTSPHFRAVWNNHPHFDKQFRAAVAQVRRCDSIPQPSRPASKSPATMSLRYAFDVWVAVPACFEPLGRTSRGGHVFALENTVTVHGQGSTHGVFARVFPARDITMFVDVKGRAR